MPDAREPLRPYFEEVQSHYDLSDDFFALFLDPSRTYSCAYFEREGMTLEEAQRAKLDLALGKCGLRRGHRLLDIGCGWGSLARRAAEAYGVDVVGLTLSRNQHAYATATLGSLPEGAGRVEIRLAGWEQFDEPVDRIVSIGAFEHFRVARHAAFFERCRSLLPKDGRMLLHTIVQPDLETLARRGIPLRHEDVLFAKFIRREIFPGGQLCQPELVARGAEAAGFHVERVQSLQPHYARTLDLWASRLAAARERAEALASPEVFSTTMRYLTGCAAYFRSGHLDVVQFTLSLRAP
ncbi:MAG: cyclopropane mycolic acid synthase family methyltransferase [Planctomycetaceae bacterium]